MVSEVVATNLQIWRQKSFDGTITRGEMKEAIALIRAERVGASERSATSKSTRTTAKAKAAPVDSDALLDELF